VARALEKDPRRRFASMTDFVHELELCLGGAAATRVVVPRRRRVAMSSRRTLALAAGGLVLVGLAVAIGLTRGHLRVPRLGTPKALATDVHLTAAAAYDPPPGDGVEDNAALRLATDGNAVTAWSTEHYANARFGGLKSGVGIVVSAGAAVEPTTISLRTDTPGFTAVVEAGDSPTGPFARVSSPQTCSTVTRFALNVPGPRRYYLLWITTLPTSTGPAFHADVNEIDATS
jgi:hypothetical protein